MATVTQLNNVPLATPDSADSVLGFDFQTGKARRFSVGDFANGGSVYDTIIATAGTALSGHRAVVVASDIATYADSTTNPAATGITTGAVTNGSAVTVQTTGEMVEPSWNWSNGSVYLGSTGLLTQTLPSSGAIVEIGIATAPTKLLIRLQPPIYL